MTPYDACDRLSAVDPYASRADAGSIAEPKMGGILADNIGPVSGMSLCLLGQGPPVYNFLVKLRQEPSPVLP